MDDEYGAYWDDSSTELDSEMNDDSYYSMDTDSMGQSHYGYFRGHGAVFTAPFT